MKTKDLMLLMMIPLIFVGIVVYTDQNPDITGFIPKLAVPQQDINVIGTYSVIPSFKVKADYNIEQEYGNIRLAMQSAIADCRGNGNIENCLKQKATELNWNCEPQNEYNALLYDFVDKMKDCISLPEQNIVCRFSLDQRNFDITRNFEIKLIDESHRVKIGLLGLSQLLAFDYLNIEDLFYTNFPNKDSSSQSADSVSIAVEYTNKIPTVRNVAAIAADARISLSKTLLFYKSVNGIKFIEEGEEDSFRAPQPANIIIDLPRTRGIKFCVTSSKQVNAYDSSDNQVKLRPVVYKFSVTFPKPEEITQAQDTANQPTD